MPQLEVMELWGRWGSGTASIFRFERRGRRPKIQLLSRTEYCIRYLSSKCTKRIGVDMESKAIGSGFRNQTQKS